MATTTNAEASAIILVVGSSTLSSVVVEGSSGLRARDVLRGGELDAAHALLVIPRSLTRVSEHSTRACSHSRSEWDA
eukprot:2432347-Pleurochrysis_carterae.AAC.1